MAEVNDPTAIETLRLRSSDNRVFKISLKAARQSLMINEMLETLNSDVNTMNDEDNFIPLSNIKGDILGKVVEWCEKHKDDPLVQEDPIDGENGNTLSSDNIPAWDVEFFKTDLTELYDIIVAANYLNVKKMLDNVCKTVANMIKGKSTDEIKKNFHLDDLAERRRNTPDESSAMESSQIEEQQASVSDNTSAIDIDAPSVKNEGPCRSS